MSRFEVNVEIQNSTQCPGPVRVICWLLCISYPVAHIALGSVYLNECPRNHYIPIYLIVIGVFGVVQSVTSRLSDIQAFRIWNTLTITFLFCWFITGNVWIYSVYTPDFNKNTTNIDQYCDKTLYLFAFWTTNVNYIILGLILVCCCCCCFVCGVVSACSGLNDVEVPV